MIRTLLVAAVMLVATANGAVAGGRYPLFDVTHLDHRLAHVSSVLFDVRDFELEAPPASIVITAPPGYTFAHADPDDMILISAKPAGGGPNQRVVATLGAPTTVSVCVPGKHDLTWDAHAGSVSIPFAVDRTTASTRFTICLDSVRATGLRITEVNFGVSLRTPAKMGQFRFSALVAPLIGPTYELRAFADLPMRLTSKATYSAATKTLTVSGKLLAENKPAAGRAVWVSTQYPSVLRDRALGTTVTRSDGTYVLTTKTTEPPPAVGTFVFNVYGAGCHAKSSAPGGCKSESLDSIQNNDIVVAGRTTAPKRS